MFASIEFPMRFAQHLSTACFVLFLLCAAPGSPAIAQTPSQPSQIASAEKISEIIEKSKVFSTGYKLKATVSGNEAVLSTYINRESKDKDRDCKIDASLIAKELMISNELGLRRIVVNFHEPDLTGKYRNVTVSYAEIKAFAAGAVEQEDFLSSINLKLLQDAGKSKDDTETASAESHLPEKSESAGMQDETQAPKDNTLADPASNAKETARGGPDSSSSKLPAKEIAKPIYTHRSTGISFTVPRDWSVEDKFIPGGGLLFKLHSKRTGMSNLELSVQQSTLSPGQCALAQKKKFAYTGVNFERYQSLKFGKGGYDGALIILTYPHESSERYYEMHLYFGKTNTIFDLWGWCPVKEYSTVGSAFSELMNSLSFQASPAAKPGIKSGKPSRGKH